MNKEQLETIKKGYQWWLEAENQADKNEFAECITTEDVPALIAEVERLQKERTALEFHLKISSCALEIEGAKADKFQQALEKIYDDIGILTSQEIYRIVEDALEGTTALGGDDNGNNYNYAAD